MVMGIFPFWAACYQLGIGSALRSNMIRNFHKYMSFLISITQMGALSYLCYLKILNILNFNSLYLIFLKTFFLKVILSLKVYTFAYLQRLLTISKNNIIQILQSYWLSILSDGKFLFSACVGEGEVA